MSLRASGCVASHATLDDVPWHRVVNAKGRISARNTDAAPCNQRCRLTEDGVVVTDDGRVESFPGIRHVF